MYGTDGQHVLKFGFISPLETGCLANAGIKVIHLFSKVFFCCQILDTKRFSLILMKLIFDGVSMEQKK